MPQSEEERRELAPVIQVKVRQRDMSHLGPWDTEESRSVHGSRPAIQEESDIPGFDPIPGRGAACRGGGGAGAQDPKLHQGGPRYTMRLKKIPSGVASRTR